MSKLVKTVLLVVLLVAGLVTFSSCYYEDAATNAEKAQTSALMAAAMSEVGMPDIVNFYEKKMAKEIFELRDDSTLICYAYNYSEYLAGYIFIGQCMGYGLPYSTQYTQPEKFEAHTNGNITVPQADPNGLYSADGLSATWLMMIDEDTGERYVMYCEPTIVVTQNPLPDRLVIK